MLRAYGQYRAQIGHLEQMPQEAAAALQGASSARRRGGYRGRRVRCDSAGVDILSPRLARVAA